MKILVTIVLLCFLSGSSMVFAQVKDKEIKSIRIPAEKSKKDKDSTPNKVKVAPKLDKEADKIEGNKINGMSIKGVRRYVIKESEKPFSMLQNDGLTNPGEIFEERWRKEAAKGGIIRTMSDQFLGEHRVDTKFVNIVCRDHEYPDGDRVQVSLNEYITHTNVLLTSSYRRLQINLSEGKNTIEILALNQGESGPNTAEFVVYDDKGRLISAKEWNLLTGVKATIVFYNEKVVIKEKGETDEASNN